uniref:Thyroglobulin type-1 domain-containing protein n=1 Tax=Branchiostoma floridae TaxID=7739 RepID=C3ZZ07_BRAFL|eukprot:XP_002586198.1 hypothetical protein BRAFLDRAFT_109559 [Branchiostoma floridae]
MKVLFVNVLFVFAFLTVPLVLGIYIPPEEKILSCAARQKAGTDPFPLHCADDGTFKPRQCDVTAGLCYCAHPERGTIYSETAVPAGQAHAQGPDCDKYWREHDAPDDDAVPMLLMLPVDPPVAITALSNDIEQPAADSNDIEQAAADKPSSAVKITNKQLNLPKQVSVDEQGDVTKTDTDVTPDSAPIAVPVLYSSKDDQGKQTEPAGRPVPVLYNTKDDQSEQTDQAGRPVPVLYNKVPDDIRIDADNHTKIPEVKPTEDIPPVIGSLCNKTVTNCTQDILSNPTDPTPTGEHDGHTTSSPPADPTGEHGEDSTSAPPADPAPTEEYGGHSTSPPAIQQSHAAEFVTVPEKSFLFDLRVTSLAWTPSLGNSSSEEYVTMETRYEDIDLCDFAQCEAHSRCVAPPGAQVPLCRCDAGYGSVGGAACTSRCELEPGFCRNDGRCDVQPELGVICRWERLLCP